VRVRVHEPGLVSTAACGRVYLICYQQLTTVAIEQRIWADYLVHREAVGGSTLVLARVDHAPLPLPSVEVRAVWRASMEHSPGVLGFAVLGRGFVGLASAALTNLLEHLVDPLYGIRFRVFTGAEPAIAWLGEVAPLAASEAELCATLEALSAVCRRDEPAG
jgi:hypothetical protein